MKVNREAQYMVDVLLLDVPHAVWTSLNCLHPQYPFCDGLPESCIRFSRSQQNHHGKRRSPQLRPLGSALRLYVLPTGVLLCEFDAWHVQKLTKLKPRKPFQSNYQEQRRYQRSLRLSLARNTIH